MSDELLPYYNEELAYIRQMGAGFALRHPAVAAQLRVGPNGSDDPHVARLLQGFAYLTARVRRKIDDQFPELTDAMLSVLYPHYLAPVPSMMIAQMSLGQDQAGLAAGYAVPRGTGVDTDAIEGEPCRFRTCYDLKLFPLSVVGATLGRSQVQSSKVNIPTGTQGVLRLRLESFGDDAPVSKLDFNTLRFHISGQPEESRLLYELLFNHLIDVQACAGAHNSPGLPIGVEDVTPAGFEDDEAILPYPAQSFPGYRLLSEYFSLPEKFLFFDVKIDASVRAAMGRKMDLYFFLNRAATEIENSVTAGTFRLGCTPLVNLFSQATEPVDLTHRQLEYRVVPDAHRPKAMEVYSVDRVASTDSRAQVTEYAPFFSIRHGVAQQEQKTFWHGSRRPAEPADGSVDEGTEVYLSFTDLGFNAQSPADTSIDVQTTCLNRDLPSQLPFGPGQPAMSLRDGGLVSKIECLTPPSRTYRQPTNRAAMWRVVSHLTLNHLSITGGADGARALREILSLYARGDRPDTDAKLQSILSTSSRRIVARAGGQAPGAFVRGVEVTIHFDESKFSDRGLFLFASVLDRFLGAYCSINSFTQLVATSQQRNGEVRRWPRRAAEQTLL